MIDRFAGLIFRRSCFPLIKESTKLGRLMISEELAGFLQTEDKLPWNTESLLL